MARDWNYSISFFVYMCQKTSFLPHPTKKSACCRTLSPFIAWIDEVRINSAVAGIKRYLFSKVFPLRLRRSNPSTPNYIYIPSPISLPLEKGEACLCDCVWLFRMRTKEQSKGNTVANQRHPHLAYRTQKKPKRLASVLCWATKIRTWNDRTRICSVTITP